MNELQALFRCLMLMGGNHPTITDAHAIFVWGRAANEWQADFHEPRGVLQVAADWHRRTEAFVVIPGYNGKNVGQGDTGYPGPDIWRPALQALGVHDQFIITTEGQGYNTTTEFEDSLDIAAEEGWDTVIGVTQYSHALRAMLAAVQSLKKRGLERKVSILPVWANDIDWSRPCYGSQGYGPFPRADWIDEEWKRIPRYQTQGDLCTLQELLNYLEMFKGVH